MTVPQLQIPSHRRNVTKKVPVPLRVREEHQDRCRQVTVPLSLGICQKHEDRRDKVSRCVTEAGYSEEKVNFCNVYFVRLFLINVKFSYIFRSAKNLFAGESFDSDIVLGQLEVARVFTEF